MRSLRGLTASLLVVALAGATVVGCGQLPSSPRQASPRASGIAMSRPLAVPPGGVEAALPEPVAISDTVDIVETLGGSLSAGRWQVVVPPLAVDGDVRMSVGVPDLDSPDCQLDIFPADKNYFNQPVILTVDCRNVDPHQLRSFVIFWFDPDKREWVPVDGSKVDFTTMTVSAPLAHCSQYGVGPSGSRAGW